VFECQLTGFDTVIAEYRNRFEDHLNTFIREMLATYASKEEERKLFTAVRAQVTPTPPLHPTHCHHFFFVNNT
jgi:hypothetical protein